MLVSEHVGLCITIKRLLPFISDLSNSGWLYKLQNMLNKTITSIIFIWGASNRSHMDINTQHQKVIKLWFVPKLTIYLRSSTQEAVLFVCKFIQKEHIASLSLQVQCTELKCAQCNEWTSS